MKKTLIGLGVVLAIGAIAYATPPVRSRVDSTLDRFRLNFRQRERDLREVLLTAAENPEPDLFPSSPDYEF